MALPSYEPDAADAVRLLAQAETLRSRARALRAEAADLDTDATELVVAADRATRAPLVMLHPTPEPEDDTRFLDRIVSELEGAGPLSVAHLAEHLGATPARVRNGLARLESIGTVARRGIKSGTRYELAGADTDDTVSANVHTFQSYEVAVRDAVVRLDTFDMVELQRELPDLAEGTVRRWVRRLEERGLLTSERVDGRNVYALTERPSGPTNRPRYVAPEVEAKTMVRDSAPVAGTGGGVRAGVPIVDELIREVRGLDPDIKVKRRSHKFAFMRGDWEIASCSSTPGASSLKGTRSQLRKAGVPVK